MRVHPHTGYAGFTPAQIMRGSPPPRLCGVHPHPIMKYELKDRFMTRFLSLFFVLATALSGFSQNQELMGKIKGSWSGPMKVGAAELTLVINITMDGASVSKVINMTS